MGAPARLLMCVTLVLGLAIIPAAFVAPVTAQSCADLIVNGGFETVGGWELGPNPVTPQYVTFTKHSGVQSLMLGITSGANVESFSSARQTVTIPAMASQATLTFWFYAMAGAPATTDYMEVVLLDTAGAILSKPWLSHNDSRLWNQMSFDLTPWRGQAVQLYFNVYNDGLGGTAAMFLDDVSLTTCSGGVTIVPTGGITLVPSGTPTPTLTPTPSGTPAPGCVNAIVNGDFSSGLASWQQVGDPAGVAPVANPVLSTPWAIQLGSLAQNLNGLASIRQLVTVPVGYPQATLGVWVYTQTQPGAGADYQQVALLNSSGTPVFVPWQAQSNNPAWTQLLFDVSGFAGQNVFVSFSVNNDGAGGRTSMVVDDVRLLSCNATPGPTATPTRTATPGIPPTTVTAIPPIITLTPVPPGCVDLLRNGGFETGWPPWIVPSNPIMPQIVTTPVFSGAFSLQVGSLTQNASSYSSARQWVTIPWSHTRVVLQFWANTWAQSLAGDDRQHVVLLAPGDTVMAVPWSVLENTRTWLPHSFDLIGLAGQTFAVYFNVINDGAGGSTAMFVDDARLWACTSGAFPPPMPMPLALAAAQSADAAVQPAIATVQSVAVASPIPQMEIVLLEPALGALTSGTTSVLAIASPMANVTRVAVALPTQTFVGTPVVPLAAAQQLVQSNFLSRIRPQEVVRWFLVAAAIVGVFLILLWLLRRLFGAPNP